MWVLLFVFDVFVCGCFFGGLFFERCPSFLLFLSSGEEINLSNKIITISTRQHLLLFPLFEERERKRERKI